MTVVLVALVVGAVYFVVHRFDGGPLVADGFNVDLFEVGQTRTFVEATLVNTGSREVRVEKVAPHWTLGGSRVQIWVPRPGPLKVPGVGGASYRTPLPSARFARALRRLRVDRRLFPFPPPGISLAELRPAAGVRLAGRTASKLTSLPLLITVTPVGQGCAGFGGLVVEYRAGLRRYRRGMRVAFGGHAAQGQPRSRLTQRQYRSRYKRCDEGLFRLADRSADRYDG